MGAPNLLGITIQLIDLVTVANMLDPVHNDPVAHLDPLLDDEKILRPIPDDDRAPVRDMNSVDDEDVPPVAIPERRLPGEEDGVSPLSADGHRAALTAAQQPVRVRELCGEVDITVPIATAQCLTGLGSVRELALVCQDKVNSSTLPVF